jgi:hypothetical protein
MKIKLFYILCFALSTMNLYGMDYQGQSNSNQEKTFVHNGCCDGIDESFKNLQISHEAEKLPTNLILKAWKKSEDRNPFEDYRFDSFDYHGLLLAKAKKYKQTGCIAESQRYNPTNIGPK